MSHFRQNDPVAIMKTILLGFSLSCSSTRLYHLKKKKGPPAKKHRSRHVPVVVIDVVDVMVMVVLVLDVVVPVVVVKLEVVLAVRVEVELLVVDHVEVIVRLWPGWSPATKNARKMELKWDLHVGYMRFLTRDFS